MQPYSKDIARLVDVVIGGFASDRSCDAIWRRHRFGAPLVVDTTVRATHWSCCCPLRMQSPSSPFEFECPARAAASLGRQSVTTNGLTFISARKHHLTRQIKPRRLLPQPARHSISLHLTFTTGSGDQGEKESQRKNRYAVSIGPRPARLDLFGAVQRIVTVADWPH